MRYDREITLLYGSNEVDVFGEPIGEVKEVTIPCLFKSVDYETQLRVTGETSKLVLRVQTPYLKQIPNRCRATLDGETSEFRIRRNPIHTTSSTFYIERDWYYE